MEATYNIIAGDGKEYGPITLAQLQQWIEEGRVTPEMQLFRSDQTGWKNAEDFAELQWGDIPLPPLEPPLEPSPAKSESKTEFRTKPGSSPPPLPETGTTTPTGTLIIPIDPEEASKRAQIVAHPFNEPHGNAVPLLEKRIFRSARWFYFIAVLSAANLAFSYLHIGVRFSIGLGLTQAFGYIAQGNNQETLLSLAPHILVIILFTFLGIVARKFQTWPFVVGMVLYAIDTGFSIAAEEWVSVAFHLLALYYIFLGFDANQKRKIIEPATGTPATA